MTNYEEMSFGKICTIPLKEFISLLEYKYKVMSIVLESSYSTENSYSWSDLWNLGSQIDNLKAKLADIEAKNL